MTTLRICNPSRRAAFTAFLCRACAVSAAVAAATPRMVRGEPSPSPRRDEVPSRSPTGRPCRCRAMLMGNSSTAPVVVVVAGVSTLGGVMTRTHAFELRGSRMHRQGAPFLRARAGTAAKPAGTVHLFATWGHIALASSAAAPASFACSDASYRNVAPLRTHASRLGYISTVLPTYRGTE